MAPESTTRGRSFDPAESAAQREREQRQSTRYTAEVKRLQRRAATSLEAPAAEKGMSPMRLEAIKRDEIAKAYRQYTPPQLRRS